MRDFDNRGTERESSVEDEVISWAHSNGWLWRLMEYRGRRGCRDVDFYGFGHIVMVEFKKRKGGVLSANQTRERQRMRNAGLTVHVIDTVEAGIALLTSMMPQEL